MTPSKPAGGGGQMRHSLDIQKKSRVKREVMEKKKLSGAGIMEGNEEGPKKSGGGTVVDGRGKKKKHVSKPTNRGL